MGAGAWFSSAPVGRVRLRRATRMPTGTNTRFVRYIVCLDRVPGNDDGQGGGKRVVPGLRQATRPLAERSRRAQRAQPGLHFGGASPRRRRPRQRARDERSETFLHAPRIPPRGLLHAGQRRVRRRGRLLRDALHRHARAERLPLRRGARAGGVRVRRPRRPHRALAPHAFGARARARFAGRRDLVRRRARGARLRGRPPGRVGLGRADLLRVLRRRAPGALQRDGRAAVRGERQGRVLRGNAHPDERRADRRARVRRVAGPRGRQASTAARGRSVPRSCIRSRCCSCSRAR